MEKLMQKIILDINIEDMISSYMSNNDEYSDINSYIRYRMSNTIEGILNKKVEEKLGDDIEGFSTEIYKVAKDTWSMSINEKIKSTINKAFDNSLQKYIDDKLSNRVDKIIDVYVKEYLDKKLMKALQEFVSNIVVVNQGDIEKERQLLEGFANDQDNGAYESGKTDMAKEISRNF